MKGLESEFVKNFVIPEKRERIIWELNNSKKRASVFWRFADSEIFMQKCLEPVDYMPPEVLASKLLALGRNTHVYYLGESYVGEIDLKTAVGKVDAGEICVIYCGNGIGYYQGEPCAIKPPRCLLKVK